eukprot:TRINITY_DN4409_c0_g1_i2.p2 TRINITY_DN4409_c0_g1~~TRINITY_DN4409_c0_g1_i2.p2  ORF type:complete len:108 (-),score=19.72 TRINITY_DN4409_c0_g1_i2:264-587(-)
MLLQSRSTLSSSSAASDVYKRQTIMSYENQDEEEYNEDNTKKEPETLEVILGRLALAFGWIVLNYLYLITFRKSIIKFLGMLLSDRVLYDENNSLSKKKIKEEKNYV